MSTAIRVDPHNQVVELFTGLEQERLAPEAKTETSSRFGALVVVLVPFGIAAWVAIGFSMYRLIT